jgi:hypothetical protein
MNKYLATVRVGGQLVITMVFADSSIHARLLIQYQFGMSSIASTPTLTTKQVEGYKLFDQVVKTIKPIKPLDPAQARVAGLKKNVDTARTALQGERDRQRQQREAEKRHKLVTPPPVL